LSFDGPLTAAGLFIKGAEVGLFDWVCYFASYFSFY